MTTDRRWLAAAVALGWVAMTLLVVGVGRFAAWDEAVYVARAAGPPGTISWSPQRALGLPLEVSVVTIFGASVPVVRLFLLVVHAAVAATALVVWQRLLGPAALVGPVVVLGSWVGLVAASEIYPNLQSALWSLLLVGALWEWVTGGRRGSAVLTVVAAVALALVRPTALAWLALSLVVAVALDRRVRRVGRRLLTVGAATFAVALVPWMVESLLSFGGPLRRLRDGQTTITGYGVGNPLVAYWNSWTRAPLDTDLGWWAIGLVLVVAGATACAWAGFRSVGDDPHGAALTVVTSAGAAKLVAYLVWPSTAGARFLLPGLLMLSVPVGVGLARLGRHRLLRGVLVAGVAGWLVWQGVVAKAVGSELEQERARLEQVGSVLAELAGGEPCSFESRYGYPSIELRSGCTGRSADSVAESVARLEDEGGGGPVFLVWVGEVDPPEAWALVDADLPDRWVLLGRDPAR